MAYALENSTMCLNNKKKFLGKNVCPSVLISDLILVFMKEMSLVLVWR